MSPYIYAQYEFEKYGIMKVQSWKRDDSSTKWNNSNTQPEEINLPNAELIGKLIWSANHKNFKQEELDSDNSL